MQEYEKLGVFYLGKTYDLEQQKLGEDLLLYDAKDLTTHAVCVGMTGSGKTGLCISLLEEAAIDGIPAIALDPKGDLGNLLLTFPQLEPGDFQPWIDPAEAARHGQSVEQYAAQTAKRWKTGLAEWGQAPERISRFREAVDLAIYTPGSNAGLPITVLRSFSAPPANLIEDGDTFRERVASATAGLLSLLGIDADPIRSRESILISNLFTKAWQEGRDLDLPRLIGEIQSPPFDKVGIVDLESFYPARERVELAMSLNNLLASPSFAGWMEGEPLDIKRLFYTEAGKPRLTVISIAHLSDAERMFFVTILLNELLAWIRTQPGTASLRALFYMDEIFGYFPPTANPPSKTPMLTLLKQARAYGLGIVLATQNPVDLDYKGLSNTGTWFLGRLQTERDKARVLEGLEGASAAAGSGFDRGRMEAVLAGLGSRVFLMNNVHEDQPVVFQTRWVMSYLRGPLTRQQIAALMEDRKNAEPPKPGASSRPAPAAGALENGPLSEAPVFPPGVEVFYLAESAPKTTGSLVYRPALLANVKLHFVKSTYKVDAWQTATVFAPIGKQLPKSVWEDADFLEGPPLELEQAPAENAAFTSAPAELSNAKNYDAWKDRLETHLYRTRRLIVYKCSELKEYSQPGESEGDFRARLRQLAREHRDLEVEKIRKKYGTKFESLRNKITTAEAAVSREESQASRAYFDSAISFGSTILGALFGRKTVSRTNVSKASTSLRSAGRAAQQKSDVARAQEKVEELKSDLQNLEQELTKAVESLEAKFEVEKLELEELEITPRKSDIGVGGISIVWTPWRIDTDGIATPAYKLPG